jgi:hypothetical protein
MVRVRFSLVPRHLNVQHLILGILKVKLLSVAEVGRNALKGLANLLMDQV